MKTKKQTVSIPQSFKKFLKRHARLWTGLKRIVVILLWIEISLQIVSFARQIYFVYQARIQLSNWYLLDKKNQWIAEERGIGSAVYHPFVGWLYTPVNTQTTHVNADYSRLTTDNPVNTNSSIPSLFFFGGSTMWGAFAKDGETIPSYVASFENKQQPTVQIKNYGHVSFNSNQEVMYLITQLKSGNIPDAVIFYDGCNDLNSAPYLVYGQPQITSYLGNMDPIMFPIANMLSINIGPEVKLTASFLADHIKIIHYPLEVTRRIREITNNRRHPIQTTAAQENLAVSIAENYQRNAAIIEALASSYHFTYRLIWQPLIYNKPLTTNERMFPKKDPQKERIYAQTTTILNTMKITNFVDLTPTFSASQSASLFIDDCHVTPEANRTLAGIIAGIYQDMMQNR